VNLKVNVAGSLFCRVDQPKPNDNNNNANSWRKFGIQAAIYICCWNLLYLRSTLHSVLSLAFRRLLKTPFASATPLLTFIVP